VSFPNVKYQPGRSVPFEQSGSPLFASSSPGLFRKTIAPARIPPAAALAAAHIETKSGVKRIDELRADNALSACFPAIEGTNMPVSAVLIGRPMRKQSETLPLILLSIPLLPVFFLGMFPMLLFAFLGFFGLGLFGLLLVCVGLGEGLHANSDFNRQIIVQGCAHRSERVVHASNLRSGNRFAAAIAATGMGLMAAGLFGALYL
jgi:hypothetical protein